MRDELVRDTVFISYRRNDRSSHVLTLKTLLCEALGESAVFHDVDMPAGTNFPIKLRGELDRAAVVLAVIGPEWLSSADAITGKRRLDDEKDWVRTELASALKNSDVLVIPLLVDDADLPGEEAQLPEAIAGLSRRTVRRLHTDTFKNDLQPVIQDIRSHVRIAVRASPAGGQSPVAPGSSGHLRGRRRRLGKWLVQIVGKWLVQAIFAGIVSVAIGALWLTLTGDKEQQSYSNSITDSPTTDTVDKPASEVAEGLVYWVAQRSLIMRKELSSKAAGVLVQNITGKEVVHLTIARGEKRLAFETLVGPLRQIAFINYDDASVPIVLSDPGQSRWPSFNSIGDQLVYATDRDRNWNLYVRELAGESRQLTNDSGDETQPAWCWSTNEIAFVTKRSGNADIYLMSASGDSPRPVIASGVDEEAPAWSPDGTSLAYRARVDGDWEIFVLDIKSGKARRRTFDAGEDGPPAFTASGQSLVWYSQTRGGLVVGPVAGSSSTFFAPATVDADPVGVTSLG